MAKAESESSKTLEQVLDEKFPGVSGSNPDKAADNY